MARRFQKTLADYLVIGVSPTLIMTLIGSLVFFLTAMFYRGQFEARLHWVLAQFVLATVLIARISMEEGREYAALFAVPLAAVSVAAMCALRGVQRPAGRVWVHFQLWAARPDLVVRRQTDLGLHADRRTRGRLGRGAAAACRVGRRAAAGATGWFGRTGVARRRIERRQAIPLVAAVCKAPPPTHPPGVWVVYFSLAALPIFGVGQRLLPSHEPAARAYGFRLLCVYVASALGLLLTTSFLGLRRYLRQKRLPMPADMAGLWLGVGVAMIAAMLAVAALLPRPGGPVSAESARAHRVGRPAGRVEPERRP